jgi:hypothetical protein
MHITLGQWLDGEQGGRPASQLAAPVCGPLGVLDLLETHLGLLRATTTSVERVAQYRICLALADMPARFYHASFAVDPLGTAATLLAWRDAWWLHGWDGTLPARVPERLHDMAAVEAHADGRLALSIGERLAAVERMLDRRQPSFESITLLDPLEGFPKRWRAVLGQLSCVAAHPPAPAAGATTVLGQLQRALHAAHADSQAVAPIPWADDGSLQVVSAQTRLLAARWLAHLRISGSVDDWALVASDERTGLEAAFEAADVARQGFLDRSARVPALQVLPLALGTLWQPLNVHALLEFLAHPIGPLPPGVRRKLARVVAAQPGLGGDVWRKTVEELASVDPKRAEAVRAAIAFWIEHPRFEPSPGAPVSAVLARVQAVRDWFQSGLGGDDPALAAMNAAGHAQAAAACHALEALAAQGVESIDPAAVAAIVAEATGAGAPNFALTAEVGRVPWVTDPGALVESFDTVVWWQMASQTMPAPSAWGLSERAALSAAGVDVPEVADVLERRARDSLRPIFNARRQLVLVLPPPGSEPHPLWQTIQCLIPGIVPRSLEDWLFTPGHGAGVAVAHTPLPVPVRWWQVAPGVVPAVREKESYTSLDAYLNGPYQWVLQYAAHLATPPLLSVSDGNQLYGQLAHRLIDRLFAHEQPLAMKGAQLERWFDTAFDDLLHTEGAVLQMIGRGHDLQALRVRLHSAVKELLHQLVVADVVAVASERELSGAFVGGPLTGYGDLVVTNREGTRAIIDMKWSGTLYRRSELSDARHVQLAFYAELLRQETGSAPHVAFFILEDARMLALDRVFFPAAFAVAGADPVSTARLWQQVVGTWQWRHAQIQAGAIEVSAEGIESDAQSVVPEGVFIPEDRRAAWDDYRWLTGWEG